MRQRIEKRNILERMSSCQFFGAVKQEETVVIKFTEMVHICSLTSIRLRHPLNAVPVLGDVHDGDTWHFPQPPLQVSVAGGHDVAFVLWEEPEGGVSGWSQPWCEQERT